MGRSGFVAGDKKRKHYAKPRLYWAVGEYLAAARKRSGLTQRSVSLALGYSSAQFISNFERGIAVPTMKKLVAMRRLYKMDVCELVEVLMRAKKEVLADRILDGNKQKKEGCSRVREGAYATRRKGVGKSGDTYSVSRQITQAGTRQNASSGFRQNP